MSIFFSVAVLLQAAEPAGKSPITQTNAPPKAEKSSGGDLNALFRMHYANRVRSFKEQNLAWQNVVLLGDSITEGFEVTKYFPGRHVINRGIGADIIGNATPPDEPRGLLKRLDNSVFDCAATDVFLLIGINDLNSGRTVDVMEQGYRELLKRIHEKFRRCASTCNRFCRRAATLRSTTRRCWN
jgi:lysophospholipase L1-like esterase